MNTGNRDLGIESIRARQNQSCYGMGLGVIILDQVYPGFPGDVRNASTYPYPVQYEVVAGVDIPKLVWAEDKSPCLEPIIQAARKLERLGCRAISAECGYFAWFQQDVAAAVDVPVLMSSLLQVPLAQRIIGPDKVVGILVDEKWAFTDSHLTAVGIDPASKLVIGGASDNGRCPQFDNLWNVKIRPEVPCADYQKAEADFVAVASEFYENVPNMGAMVLECTGFPPFARALQREIDIPVFSYATLLDFAHSITNHRDFYGHI